MHAASLPHASAGGLQINGQMRCVTLQRGLMQRAHVQTELGSAAAHTHRSCGLFRCALMQLTRVVPACSAQYLVPKSCVNSASVTMMRSLRRCVLRLRVYVGPQCDQVFTVGHAVRCCSACTHRSQQATWVQGSPAEKARKLQVHVLMHATALLYSTWHILKACTRPRESPNVLQRSTRLPSTPSSTHEITMNQVSNLHIEIKVQTLDRVFLHRFRDVSDHRFAPQHRASTYSHRSRRQRAWPLQLGCASRLAPVGPRAAAVNRAYASSARCVTCEGAALPPAQLGDHLLS